MKTSEEIVWDLVGQIECKQCHEIIEFKGWRKFIMKSIIKWLLKTMSVNDVVEFMRKTYAKHGH